uniref:Uncharacterized protein n=1 Tax=Moniliophthora roreri TaxID=221103 RepID=A0A0W0FJM4_MONRR
MVHLRSLAHIHVL